MDNTYQPAVTNNDAAFSTGYFKKLAKEHLNGAWGAVIGMSLILWLFSLVVPFIPVVGQFAGFLFGGVIAMGYVAIAMAVVHGKKPDTTDAFSGFNQFWRNFVAYFLMMLFIWLWSLLLIIPGIIKIYSYSATFFLLNRYPEMGAKDAITKSRAIMDGHKMEAFYLGLSFIGWILLVIVTFGLAGFYVFPYMNVTTAEFYNKLIDDDAAAAAKPITA